MAHLGYEKRAAMNIHGIQNGIMELTAMGFAAEQAQKALQETGGNQEAAIELLLLCDVPAEEIVASTTGSGSEDASVAEGAVATLANLSDAETSSEGAAHSEIKDALPADPCDATTATAASQEGSAATADETAEHDFPQASRNATAWDHAQIFLSSCNSTIRSKVSKHNDLEADSAVNAIDSQASAVETFDLIAVGHDPMAENGVDALSDGAETDDYSFVEVSDLGEPSCQWEYVHEAGSDGDAAGVPTVGDDSLEHFYDASEASDCYLTEGTYQHVYAHVSLLDRAQVFCSQSLSAVRSKVPEITHHVVEHPTSHCSETHVPFVQEGGFEASTSGEVMREKTPKAGTIPEDVAPHASESHDFLAESAETDEELSVAGSTESCVACTRFSAAATSRAYSDQTYVNATRADRAQVFVSLSASALRSGLSALLLQSRAIAA